MITTVLHAQTVPGLIDYQGRLTDDLGNVVNGTVSIDFAIYDVASGGTPIWTETQSPVQVSNGLFHVLLGSDIPINVSLFDGTYRWLGIDVDGDGEMEPRTRIASVAFAQQSEEAEHADYAGVASAAYHADYADVAGSAPADWDWLTSGDDIYRETGNVGIGTSIPDVTLDVDGSIRASEEITASGENAKITVNSQGTANPTFRFRFSGVTNWAMFPSSGGTLYFSNSTGSYPLSLTQEGGLTHTFTGTSNGLHASGSTPNALYYIANDYAGEGWGLSAGMNNSSASETSYGLYGFNQGHGVGVYGKNFYSNNYGHLGSDLYGVYGQHHTTNFGFVGSNNYGVYGEHNEGNYGFLGGEHHGVYAYLDNSIPGDYAIKGMGTGSFSQDGTSYEYGHTIGGVLGVSWYGNTYTFGVSGYSHLYNSRSGGLIGSEYNASVWGSLGYRDSGGTLYGGYFTSYTTGSGLREPGDEAETGIGLGAWGDLLGADIHGHVYGTYTEGEHYGLFSHGAIVRDDLDVHLQKTESEETAVLFTNVSTDVSVYTSGTARLVDGRSRVSFPDDFRRVVSTEIPVVVTVTPMGESNGVYLTDVDASGFSVTENARGSSNTEFSFIAVGRRAGFEQPQLPAEIVAGDYVEKLERGLHNDADTTTDGEGLYYENGRLTVGIHPSTLPDTRGRMEEPEDVERPTPEPVPVAAQAGTGRAPQKGADHEIQR